MDILSVSDVLCEGGDWLLERLNNARVSPLNSDELAVEFHEWRDREMSKSSGTSKVRFSEIIELLCGQKGPLAVRTGSYYEPGLAVTEKGRGFWREGGFQEKRRRALAIQRKKEDREFLDEEAKRVSIDVGISQIEHNEKALKRSNWAIGIALLAFLFEICRYLYPIFEKALEDSGQ